MLVSILKRLGLKFSLNDPQWGRGSQDENRNNQNNDGKRPNNNGGPPDLDQLWRDFNQRFNRLLGKKNGGGGSDGGDFKKDSMKGTGIGAGIILLIVARLWFASGFFIVQEGQTAVVLTFGKYSYTTTPGFNWRWPY